MGGEERHIKDKDNTLSVQCHIRYGPQPSINLLPSNTDASPLISFQGPAPSTDFQINYFSGIYSGGFLLGLSMEKHKCLCQKATGSISYVSSLAIFFYHTLLFLVLQLEFKALVRAVLQWNRPEAFSDVSRLL